MTNQLQKPSREKIRRGLNVARMLAEASNHEIRLGVAIIDTATDEQMAFLERLIETVQARRGAA